MTPLLWLSATLLGVLTAAQTSRAPAAEAGADSARHPASCHWRLDTVGVWECLLRAGVENSVIRPDYRAVELRVLCENAPPGHMSADLFDQVSDIRRLDVRQCAVTRIEDRALHHFIALRHLSLNSFSPPGLIVSNQTFRHLHKLESVDLSGNHIEYLPRSALCRLHRLMHLNLSANALVELELGFGPERRRKNCGHALRELDLSANALRSVRARSFAKHVSLQRLLLASNRIERLSEVSFSGLGELRVLDMSDNRLVTLPTGVLTPLRQLAILQLQENRLTVLPPRAFAGLEQLVSLNLSANQLTTPADFANLARLLQLDLSRNRLVELGPGFRRLNSLQVLDLSHNELAHLPVGALVDLTNLVELDLSHNQLSTLVAGALMGLGALTTLRLDHNQLLALQPGSLANCSGVQRLLLSHNRLADVPAALRALTLLQELDLASNRLLFVDDDAFQNLDGLLTLDLSYNMLMNLSARSLEPLASLSWLDVSHNSLRSLQGVLRRNRLLTELNVSDNKLTNLVGVAGWLFNLRHLNASGNMLTLFDYAMIPPQLRQLDISRNHLRSLDDNYEHPAMELQEIDASGNKITRVTRSLLPDSIEVVHLENNRISDVEPYSFVGKTYLQMVDLSTNDMERLNETSVRLSVERAEFRLAGNPLVCDCHSEWLSRPAGQLAVTDLDQVLCRLQHRGRPVQRAVADAQFLCSYERHCFQLCQCCEYDACDCEQTCPKNCTCLHNNIWTTNVIMCAAQGLTVVPNSIPMDATDIMLDGNDLNRLYDLSFLGRKSLKSLFLNNSNVMSVSNRTFQGLSSLQYLHLQDNRLRKFEGEEMLDLIGLRELYLHNNRLEYINTTLFRSMDFLQVLDLSGNRLTQLSVWTITQPTLSISLAGNQWLCECGFRFRFRRWLLQRYQQVTDVEAVACSSGDVIVVESECRGLRTTASSSLWIYAVAAAVCLAATAAVLACFVCRRLGRQGASLHKSTPSPAYDAFVSYDARDAPLANQLAVELPHLRLCLLHRDTSDSPDAIVDAMHASRAVVLVLTDAFLSRAWCRFDFKHAHMAALGSARRPLVLIDVDEVCGALDLDPDLALLSRTCPVLSWRDKQLGRRLQQCLPPAAAGWRPPHPPDEYADDYGPVYACIVDDDPARSPSTAPSEKVLIAGPPRTNITVNPVTGPAGARTPTRGGQVQMTSAPGSKVQLTPSYFV